MKPSTILFRHGPPSQYDHAPQGALCCIRHLNHLVDLYVQTSGQEDRPVWQLIDHNINESLLNDKEFIENCIDIYKK